MKRRLEDLSLLDRRLLVAHLRRRFQGRIAPHVLDI